MAHWKSRFQTIIHCLLTQKNAYRNLWSKITACIRNRIRIEEWITQNFINSDTVNFYEDINRLIAESIFGLNVSCVRMHMYIYKYTCFECNHTNDEINVWFFWFYSLLITPIGVFFRSSHEYLWAVNQTPVKIVIHHFA